MIHAYYQEVFKAFWIKQYKAHSGNSGSFRGCQTI